MLYTLYTLNIVTIGEGPHLWSFHQSWTLYSRVTPCSRDWSMDRDLLTQVISMKKDITLLNVELSNGICTKTCIVLKINLKQQFCFIVSII